MNQETNSPAAPRFIIHGAGAIGSILGGLLATAGYRAVLIGRAAHVAAIKRDGLLLVRADGSEQRIQLEAVVEPAELSPAANDCLVLTVKAQQTTEAVEQLRAVFPAETPIITLQNGVRNEEVAARVFRRVYGALVAYSGNFMQPGVIQYTVGDQMALGCFPEGLDDFIKQVTEIFNQAGFRTTAHERVMNVKWAKLVVNLNNATHAILDLWVQLSQSDRDVRHFMADVCEEGLRVLDAAGISVADPHNLLPVREEIERLRAGELRDRAAALAIPVPVRHYPSTWQDLKLKRGATEGDLFNGEIVRLGQKHNGPTPYNSTLLEILTEMEQRGEEPGRHTLAELRALVQARMVR